MKEALDSVPSLTQLCLGAYVYNPNTGKVEARGSGVQGLLWLHEFQISLGYISIMLKETVVSYYLCSHYAYLYP